MPQKKHLWFVALIAFVLCTGGCATTSVTAPRPCVEAAVNPVLPLCETNLTEAQCRERTEFIAAQTEKTVVVWVASYTQTNGVFYHRGTGTFIKENGLVVTAEHVVRDADFISIDVRRFSENRKEILRVRGVKMQIIAISREKDIAFLLPKTTETLPAPMPTLARPIDAGEQLWQFGTTSLWRHGPFVKDGVNTQGFAGLFKVDIVSDGGDSGGPLVTEKGELAGVLIRNEKFGESPTYFVPIADALTVLEKQR